jgi:hypothetical protein
MVKRKPPCLIAVRRTFPLVGPDWAPCLLGEQEEDQRGDGGNGPVLGLTVWKRSTKRLGR